MKVNDVKKFYACCEGLIMKNCTIMTLEVSFQSRVNSLLLILLSSVRLCCPKGGVYTNVLTFLFEVFMMAPCLACKWASGKGKQRANCATGDKPRYGGTDDVELGDK